MTVFPLWAVFTLVAAACQTARNAMQRELTTKLGTVGATHVRFLFGFPFALLFLGGVLFVSGRGLPIAPARNDITITPEVAIRIASANGSVRCSPKKIRPNSATCTGSVLI